MIAIFLFLFSVEVLWLSQPIKLANIQYRKFCKYRMIEIFFFCFELRFTAQSTHKVHDEPISLPNHTFS